MSHGKHYLVTLTGAHARIVLCVYADRADVQDTARAILWEDCGLANSALDKFVWEVTRSDECFEDM